MADDGWAKGPEIGEGATYSIGSDSYAYTIIDVSDQTVTFMLENRWDKDKDPISGLWVLKTKEVTWPKAIWVTRDDDKFDHSKKEMTYKSSMDMENAEKYILKGKRYYKASKKLNPNTGKYEYGNTTSTKNGSIGIGFRRAYLDPSF